jgi:hypothetical protein
MDRLKFGILLAALAALTVTSIAVADESQPSSREPVAAHFTATGPVTTVPCNTGSNSNASANTKERHGQLAGTSTSADQRLNGPVQIRLRVVLNGKGVGIATGTFRIAGKVEADVVAVVSDTNRLDGFLRTSRGGKKLFANFSATLAARAPGATPGSAVTGDIGSGSHLNTAVLGRGGC